MPTKSLQYFNAKAQAEDGKKEPPMRVDKSQCIQRTSVHALKTKKRMWLEGA